MKRLLVLTILSVSVASSACCARPSRCTPCRPPCMPTSACGGAVETYSTPTIMTTTPTLTMPQSMPAQNIPGPDAYVPSSNH